MLAGVIGRCRLFFRLYGRALLFASLLHALVLLALTQVPFKQKRVQVVSEPISSYLYRSVTPEPAEPELAVPAKLQLSEPSAGQLQATAARPTQAAVKSADSKNKPAPKPTMEAGTSTAVLDVEPGIASRALGRAAMADPSAIERSAQASYQQFLQAQQQGKITVEGRYQQSTDPAGQVLAQLDDGRQIIRTRDGCKIADPTKDGFDGLMATRTVPCGDKASSAELLKQALEKHSKR